MDGSPRPAELDGPGVASHLTVKKSVAESVFCVWVTPVMCFFLAAGLFKAYSPMLDSEKVLHIVFILLLCCLQALMLTKLYTDPLTSSHC